MTNPTPFERAEAVWKECERHRGSYHPNDRSFYILEFSKAFEAQDAELKELRKERDEARKVISFYSRGGGLRINFKTKMLESSDNQDKNPFYGSLAREYLAKFKGEK